MTSPDLEDKDRMEATLRDSDADWIAVRLPNVVEGPAKPIRTSDDGRGLSISITTGSVAHFVVERLAAKEAAGAAGATPSISN